MILHRIALLAGLFAVPLLLLSMGHRFRDRANPDRHRFWGAVIGYLAGMAAATTAMLAPPIDWAGGDAARAAIVHWAMLAGFLLGLLAGSLVPPRRPPRRRPQATSAP